MTRALELMKQGSYQVKMSDEGRMAEDIEGCLQVVLEAVRKSDVAATEKLAWCLAMLESDRMGFLIREPLGRCGISSGRLRHGS